MLSKEHIMIVRLLAKLEIDLETTQGILMSIMKVNGEKRFLNYLMNLNSKPTQQEVLNEMKRIMNI